MPYSCPLTLCRFDVLSLLEKIEHRGTETRRFERGVFELEGVISRQVGLA